MSKSHLKAQIDHKLTKYCPIFAQILENQTPTLLFALFKTKDELDAKFHDWVPRKTL